jgi:hypothetical protein
MISSQRIMAILAMVSMLFAAFAGWLALETRVTKVEVRLLDSRLSNIPDRLTRLEMNQQSICLARGIQCVPRAGRDDS